MSIDEKAFKAARHVYTASLHADQDNESALRCAIIAYERATATEQPVQKPIGYMNDDVALFEGGGGDFRVVTSPGGMYNTPLYLNPTEREAQQPDNCLTAFEEWMAEKRLSTEKAEGDVPPFKVGRVEAMWEGFICAWEMRQPEREAVNPDLYDELYHAAEDAIAYINRHPYGQPISGRIRRALQAIVAAKLKISEEQGRRGSDA